MTQRGGPFEIEGGTWQERLQVVLETMRAMSMHSDPSAMVQDTTIRISRLIPGDRVLALTRRGVEPPGFLVSRDSWREERIDPWHERHRLPRLEGGLLGELFHSQEPRIIDSLEVDPDDPSHPYLLGMGSLIAIPVFDKGQAMNMMVRTLRRKGGFDHEVLPEMVMITNLFGRVTHNLVLSRELELAYRTVDEEMQTIADIQTSLLPRELPSLDGLDLAAHYRPAARAGGDYYDFFPHPEGKLGILIGDVSGHGSPAAVLMAVCHCLAHTRPGDAEHPAQVLSYVNRNLARLYTRESGAFMTAFYGVFDPASKSLTYASAGHPPPRVKRCVDDTLHSLDAAGGVPLGIFPEAGYEEALAELVPGDQVVFYTDGVTETFDARRRMFGLERLDDSIAQCHLDAAGLIETVLADLDRFASGHPAADDRTIIVAKLR